MGNNPIAVFQHFADDLRIASLVKIDESAKHGGEVEQETVENEKNAMGRWTGVFGGETLCLCPPPPSLNHCSPPFVSNDLAFSETRLPTRCENDCPDVVVACKPTGDEPAMIFVFA
jgi:hypothetical protein